MSWTNADFFWVVGYFQGKGSFCITGKARNKCFALEVFTIDKEPLEKLQRIMTGHIYPPPPAAPSRWTWRLYGKDAVFLYSLLKPYLSQRLTERGDRKLKISKGDQCPTIDPQEL